MTQLIISYIEIGKINNLDKEEMKSLIFSNYESFELEDILAIALIYILTSSIINIFKRNS